MPGLDPNILQSMRAKELMQMKLQEKHFDLACQIYVRNFKLEDNNTQRKLLAMSALEAASVMFITAGLAKGEDHGKETNRLDV